MKKTFSFLLILLFTTATFNNSSAQCVNYANPFIGTGGHGHTFPGASLPFGMVQLSPDTRIEGWDGCSGYHYSDSIILGFSHTHLSGTGVSDYADILFMPMVNKYSFTNGTENNFTEGYFSKFKKSTEHAAPGYYSVFLTNPKVKVELTAGKRTGFQQYIFSKTKKAYVVVDLKHRDDVIYSSIKKISKNEIAGVRESSSWAKHQYIYFVARFSKPIKEFVINKNDSVLNKINEADGKNLKAAIGFCKMAKGKKLLVKVGISAVSIEGARKNLDAEIPDWNFNKIKKQASAEWEKEFNKIQVEGNEQKKEIFYSALYHCLLSPNLFMDVDGKYRGTDLKIHHASDFTNYTIFSLWDTYRAEHPLFTIIDRKRTNNFIKTFLHQYTNGGKLPVWELAGNYTGCMIGYHSVSVIADAYLKGIKNYDENLAFEAMKHSAMSDELGLKAYKKYGFIPSEEESESIYKTLEYAYDDWCIAQMAKALGKNDDYKYFITRAQSYKNIYDPNTGFMRPKHYGVWKNPFNASEVDFNFTEANSWQYSFYVPQDLSGLIKLYKGKENFDKKLDLLFSSSTQMAGRTQVDITGLIGQYAHGNEPSHHMAYLYNYIGKPWKTQKMIHRITNEFYTSQADGLAGNEDCGQMSAWYVLSSLGFYPVTPGSNDFVFGSPLFKKSIINLENGKKFIIKAQNISNENYYIQSVLLNNKAYTKTYITYNDIMAGGELLFVMGSEPNKSYGIDEKNFPKSKISNNLILPVPYSNVKNRIFIDSIKVELFSVASNSKIYYSQKNSLLKKDFVQYTKPIIIEETDTLNYYTINSQNVKSKITKLNLYKFPKGKNISLKYPVHPQYTGGGDSALIDGIIGKDNFRLGAWQGFYGVDLNAVVDLGKTTSVSEFSADFIQDINSWIFMPKYVEYSYSADGKKYFPISRVNNTVAEDNWDVTRNNFHIKIKPINARYIKIIGKTKEYCPDWHKGHGNKLFIFTDEITIR
ncbi:MAG: GH92 family glycosyl hydrolase [Bacteroidetes bacterium]|nr:GH92 family glycosyl hydrolase [Bacteroidota bacterium]